MNERLGIEAFDEYPELRELIDMWGNFLDMLDTETPVRAAKVFDDIEKRADDICDQIYPQEDPREWKKKALALAIHARSSMQFITPEGIGGDSHV